jgi:hypothetical protein
MSEFGWNLIIAAAYEESTIGVRVIGIDFDEDAIRLAAIAIAFAASIPAQECPVSIASAHHLR